MLIWFPIDCWYWLTPIWPNIVTLIERLTEVKCSDQNSFLIIVIIVIIITVGHLRIPGQLSKNYFECLLSYLSLRFYTKISGFDYNVCLKKNTLQPSPIFSICTHQIINKNFFLSHCFLCATILEFFSKLL